MDGVVEIADDVGPLAVARERYRARPLADGKTFDRDDVDIGIVDEQVPNPLGKSGAWMIEVVLALADLSPATDANEYCGARAHFLCAAETG